MAITVTCPGEACGKSFKVKDEFAGKKARCPACQSPILIPAASGSVPPVPRPPIPPLPIPRPPAPAVPGRPHLPQVFTLPRVLVKAKGFIGIRLSGSARVTHEICEPGKKEAVAVVRKEKRPFDWLALFGLSSKPTRLDVREEEDGPNLFSLLLSRTAMSQVWSKGPSQIDIELLDPEGEPLGRFRFRGGLLSPTATLTFTGPDGEALAEVRRLSSSADGIGLALVSPGGGKLGTVRTERMSDAADSMKDGKVRMSFSVGGGPEGHVAEVEPDRVGDLATHRLLLALAVVVEATGIGNRDTGAERMGPSRRRR